MRKKEESRVVFLPNFGKGKQLVKCLDCGRITLKDALPGWKNKCPYCGAPMKI